MSGRQKTQNVTFASKVLNFGWTKIRECKFVSKVVVIKWPYICTLLCHMAGSELWEVCLQVRLLHLVVKHTMCSTSPRSGTPSATTTPSQSNRGAWVWPSFEFSSELRPDDRGACWQKQDRTPNYLRSFPPRASRVPIPDLTQQCLQRRACTSMWLRNPG